VDVCAVKPCKTIELAEKKSLNAFAHCGNLAKINQNK
jgi:hypothetical protein